MADIDPNAPVNPQQAADVIQQHAASPIRVETRTGQVFEGATQEEVLRQLVQSVENGTAHIRTQSEQIQQFQQQLEQVRQPAPQQTDKTNFQDKYWELWQKDPIQADRFAASVRLGVPMDQVDQIERQTIQNAASTAQNAAVSEFLNRCPDYPNEDAQVAQAMKTQLQRSFPGQAPTADTLELAFNALVRQGFVTPLDVPIEGYDEAQSPLPRVGSGSNLPPTDFERQFRGLSSDKQAQVLNELYIKGAR